MLSTILRLLTERESSKRLCPGPCDRSVEYRGVQERVFAPHFAGPAVSLSGSIEAWRFSGVNSPRGEFNRVNWGRFCSVNRGALRAAAIIFRTSIETRGIFGGAFRGFLQRQFWPVRHARNHREMRLPAIGAA